MGNVYRVLHFIQGQGFYNFVQVIKEKKKELPKRKWDFVIRDDEVGGYTGVLS